MKKSLLLTCVVAFGWLSVMGLSPVCQAAEEDKGKDDQVEELIPPIVFQAAGPNAASIQSTVDAFRAALGEPNNGNDPGKPSGRREINWDGGGNNDQTQPLPPDNPFDVFLNTRGARFTTLGTGLTQAPPSGGPQGGLVDLFDNPTYGDIFSTFSPLRLFTPVDSNLTQASFFLPGTNPPPADNPVSPATVSGFGAVFTDVDDGANTQLEYFDVDGKLIFSGFVPASPGDGSLSFFGVVFPDARIAQVRITTGNVAPGPDDDGENDIVMMDDVLYGEPQPIPSP